MLLWWQIYLNVKNKQQQGRQLYFRSKHTSSFLCKMLVAQGHFLSKKHPISWKMWNSPLCLPLQLVWDLPHINFQVLAYKTAHDWHKFQLKPLVTTRIFHRKQTFSGKKIVKNSSVSRTVSLGNFQQAVFRSTDSSLERRIWEIWLSSASTYDTEDERA